MFYFSAISVLFSCLVFCVVHVRSESIDVVGQNCMVTEPIYNHTFDLRLLSSDLNYKQKLNNNDFVLFNVCTNLTSKCNGKSAGACFTENSKEHIMGESGDVLLSNGRIHFNYTGDKCATNSDKRYNLQIMLMCDYSNNIKDPITHSEYSKDDCTLYVFWRTHLACLPLPNEVKSNECTASDDKSDHIFNLMPLSQYNNRIRNFDNTTFVINVCKPVLYGHEDMCPPGSSVCLENNNESNLKKKFINYGSTVANPTYENGKLFMHFTSNEKCNGTHNISSHINFNCDTSIETGEPEYLGLQACEHRFVWHTTLACNSVQACVTMDPQTGFKYDLSSLAGKQYSVQHENKTYLFGICNVARSPCLEKAGICEVIDNSQTTSLGLFNDHLKFNQTGSPYLVYVGGSVCSKPSHQWTTKIEFLCASAGMTKGPHVIENTDCQMVIQYVTDLVCQDEILCKAYNYSSDTQIDLTPLIGAKNYLATVSDTLKSTEGPPLLYYLNVCKPLVPQYGLSCPGGSAACRAKNGTLTPTSELSLGFPDVSLTVVGQRTHLKYLRGSVCPTDPDTELSSVIEFYCDVSAGRGTPILQEIMHDCHYRFEWATSIVCPSHDDEFKSNDCSIFNDELKNSLNLRQITHNGSMTVKLPAESFDLNVCENNRKVETDYAQGTVKIFFDAKGPCKPDDSYSVELRLVCKENEKHLSPVETDSCGLVLIRETPLICQFLNIIINPTIDPTTPDTPDTDANGEQTGRISAWGAIFLTLVILSVIGGIIYMTVNPDRRARVVSLFGRKSVAVQYSRVRSDEEASLLLPQPGSLSDSDDDILA